PASYETLTVTARTCVVGRPLVLSTILNVAASLPFAALTGIDSTVVLPAATFALALPAMPLPVSVAVAATWAGQATPVRLNFTFATPPAAAIDPGTSATPGVERFSARWTTPAAWMRAYTSPLGPTAMSRGT